MEQEVAQSTPSVGQRLKAAREAQGLSQQALADKLFLKVSVIEQLELDDTSQYSSPTFIKGYVRLYAKNVGLDPEPLLEELSQDANVQKPPHKLQSFSKRVSKEANDSRWMMFTYFILLVVIALFILWWYQQPDNTALNRTDTSTSAALTAEPQGEMVAANTASSTVAQNNPPQSNEVRVADTEVSASDGINDETVDRTNGFSADITSEDEVASQFSTAEQTFEEVASEDNTRQPDSGDADIDQVDEVEVSTIGSADEENGLIELVFTFQDDCWVNITDATGEAIAYGTKVQGRVMPISGVPPFVVTLGAPQNVSITYDGEPVDMSDIPAGRSARFSVPRE